MGTRFMTPNFRSKYLLSSLTTHWKKLIKRVHAALGFMESSRGGRLGGEPRQTPSTSGSSCHHSGTERPAVLIKHGGTDLSYYRGNPIDFLQHRAGVNHLKWWSCALGLRQRGSPCGCSAPTARALHEGWAETCPVFPVTVG